MKTKSLILSAVILIFGLAILSCSDKPKIPSTGFLDLVKYEKGQCTAEGWAGDKEDGAPVQKVTVFIDGKSIGEATLGLERPGVAREMQNPTWVKSGWKLSVPIKLDKGTHKAYAVSVNKRGDNLRLHEEKVFEVN